MINKYPKYQGKLSLNEHTKHQSLVVKQEDTEKLRKKDL